MTDTPSTEWTVVAGSDGPPPWLHEEGVHIPARIIRVEHTDHAEYGPGYKIVMSENDSDDELWAFCGTKVSPKSKLTRWLTGIYGTLPDSGDMKDLYGRAVNVVYERFQAKDSMGFDTWKEKIVTMKHRELTDMEISEDELKAKLATQEAPF